MNRRIKQFYDLGLFNKEYFLYQQEYDPSFDDSFYHYYSFPFTEPHSEEIYDPRNNEFDGFDPAEHSV